MTDKEVLCVLNASNQISSFCLKRKMDEKKRRKKGQLEIVFNMIKISTTMITIHLITLTTCNCQSTYSIKFIFKLTAIR